MDVSRTKNVTVTHPISHGASRLACPGWLAGTPNAHFGNASYNQRFRNVALLFIMETNAIGNVTKTNTIGHVTET